MTTRKTLAVAGLMLGWPTGLAMAGEGCPLCLAAAESASPVAVATQSAGQGPAVLPNVVVNDPELDALLDRVDAAAEGLDTLSADVKYTTISGLLGDEQTRVGEMAYAAPANGEPQRMGIALTVRVIDGVGRSIDKRYVFDGQSWIEIDGDERRWTRYAPAENGNDHPITAMLPSNFDRDELVARYAVERRAVPGAAPDPTPTIRLRPRNAEAAEFDYADVTFDASHTPTLIEMVGGEKETRIELLNVDRNGAVNAELLDATPPTDPGWSIEDRAAE
ncbi:MAG: hypothetical protein AAGK09_04440 [Planctomycetota bacterium]